MDVSTAGWLYRDANILSFAIFDSFYLQNPSQRWCCMYNMGKIVVNKAWMTASEQWLDSWKILKAYEIVCCIQDFRCFKRTLRWCDGVYTLSLPNTITAVHRRAPAIMLRDTNFATKVHFNWRHFIGCLVKLADVSQAWNINQTKTNKPHSPAMFMIVHLQLGHIYQINSHANDLTNHYQLITMEISFFNSW